MAKPKAARCPTCGRVASWEDNAHRPFCCERCKLADLGNWALERYRIPGPPVDPEPSSDDEEPEN